MRNSGPRVRRAVLPADRLGVPQRRGGDLQEVAQQFLPPVREDGQARPHPRGIRDGEVGEVGAGVGARDTQRDERDAVSGGDELELLFK